MKKLLIVEDDLVLNRTLAYNLTEEKYDVISAMGFAEAVECLKKTEFDVALLDVNLPDGNGLSLCEEIRGRGQETLRRRNTARCICSSRIPGSS